MMTQRDEQLLDAALDSLVVQGGAVTMVRLRAAAVNAWCEWRNGQAARLQDFFLSLMPAQIEYETVRDLADAALLLYRVDVEFYDDDEQDDLRICAAFCSAVLWIERATGTKACPLWNPKMSDVVKWYAENVAAKKHVVGYDGTVAIQNRMEV